ncbi:venom acid phosphatase Acph-1 [Cephus cinctus]|uniref:acid phosphatase n=1 Tax=Cephus cinctus TaxID=211228 RepID=A0AAJ7CAU8_CEPCN|nr:venom acid phosphatase Acph-1 [Cephus cinctus]
MYPGRCILFYALSLTLADLVYCEMQVKLLHVLFRHGDKVPHQEYQNYPNDPHRNHSYYPIENGGLTNQGKMREYKIGMLLRDRYNKYFGQYYWPDMIYAQSTYFPRTQMSLQLVLAGLFPPKDKQIWNPHLPWSPVSSFFVHYNADYLLFPHLCPQYTSTYARFLREDQTREMISKYQDVMKYLSKYTGKDVSTTSAVYYLYNLFKEQAAQNLTLPKWTEKVYPKTMKDITALDFNLRSYTRDLKRLNGGMLLRKVTDDIKELRTGNLRPSGRKAFFFSAHELNVATFVRTLGTDDPVLPAYGSTVILETLQDENEMYYIRVLLWTGVTERLIVQTVPGCTEICPLDVFLDLMKNVIPTDAEYYCYGTESTNINKRNTDSAASDFWNFSKWPYLLIVIPSIVNFRYF